MIDKTRILGINRTIMVKPLEENLQKPPLKEAVFELRFQDTLWDANDLIDRLKPQYPNIQEEKALEIKLVEQSETFNKIEHKGHRLISADGSLLVRIFENRMSINYLNTVNTPYNWEAYQEKIISTLKEATKDDRIANNKLTRLGLRYVNHIDSKTAYDDIDSYFNLKVQDTTEIQHDNSIIQLTKQYTYQDTGDQMKIWLIAQTESMIILDLDYFSNISKVMDENDIFAWLDSAHDNVEKAFYSVLTEKALSLFK